MSALPHTYVFVAVQTTGPDESTDEILDLAIVADDGSTVLHTAFLPKNENDLPEDLGYTTGDLAPSPLFETKALQILGYLTDSPILGHNTQLAMRFLNRYLRLAFVEEDQEDIDKMMARIASQFIDTVTLAWEQLPALGDLSLEGVCLYLRIPYKPNHSALEDARATRTVYDTLLRGSAWKRWWWKVRSPK